MYLKRSVLGAMVLLIIGCRPAEPLAPTATDTLHDSLAPVVESSGSLLPTEALLSGSIVSLGAATAPLKLLVFTEHHCRYCREFHQDHLLRLSSDFIDRGHLQVQLINFPLQKYQNSALAAKATICAAAQGKGLAMHSALFSAYNTNLTGILNLAQPMELELDLFKNCLKSPLTEQLLKQQMQWAQTWQVEYVPTFVLNGEKFVGLPYYSELRGKIELALGQAKDDMEN